jgi:hypothetical protein
MSFSPTATVALAAVSLAAASSTDTCRASLSGPGTPKLDFTVLGPAQAGGGGTPRVDSVSAGQVVVRGVIGTPTPCYTVAARLDHDGSRVKVSLVATGLEGVCVQVLGALAYRARIYDVTAGHYSVELVRSYPDTGWPTEADTIDVDIP